jgi:hypothetical protein
MRASKPDITMNTETEPIDPSIEAFRPDSYWEDHDPLGAILRNVKGTQRRQMIRDRWNAGTIEDLSPTLLADETDPALLRLLECLHPSFMGGESLPQFLPTEVEIARIDLDSVTSDVISIRARQKPGESTIYYRIVDEYRTRFYCEPDSSDEPLTHGELVSLIEEAGELGLRFNAENLPYHPDLESLRCFTTVSSAFYPNLYDHYDKIHEEWFRELLDQAEADRGRNEDDDD